MFDLKRLSLYACVLLVLGVAACTKSPQERHKVSMQNGLQMMEKKDYARAILEFKNAAQAIPTDAEPYYRLGLANLAIGDFKRGVGFLQKALELNPKHGDAQLKLSELMIMSQDPTAIQEAQERLNSLLTASPGNSETMTALAVAEWKTSQVAAAEKHLMEALNRSPKNLAAAITLAKLKIEAKDFVAAEKALRSVADQQPPSADAFVTLGEFFLLQKRGEDATAQFRRATQLDPQNTQAWMDLAATELSAGRWDAAEKIYRQVAGLPGEKTRNLHALFLLQSGKVEEAIQEFSALLKKYPNDRDTRTGLVSAYISAKRMPEAEGVLNAALKGNNKDVAALIQRAGLLLARHNLDAAEADLNAALGSSSDSAQAHYMMSRLYAARTDTQRQRQQLDETLRVDPSFIPARLDLARSYTAANTPRLAVDILNQTPANQKNGSAIIAEMNWANIALGQKAQVARILKEALSQQRTPEFLLQDGVLKLDEKQYEEVRKNAREVLKSSPEDVRALQLIMQAYVSEKRVADGVAEVKKYAAEHASLAAVQQFAGSALAAQGDLEYARLAFDRAKTADPGSPTSYLSLAQLDISERKMDKSQEILKELTAKDTRNPTAYLWLGHIALIKNDYAQAVQNYQKVLTLDSNNISALNNLASILSEQTNQPDQALGYAQKARELAPNSGAVANTLGMVYYRKGLYSLALPLLKNASELEKSPNHFYDLGFVYMKTGEVVKGRETLNAALKMDSRLPEAQEARQILASSAK